MLHVGYATSLFFARTHTQWDAEWVRDANESRVTSSDFFVQLTMPTPTATSSDQLTSRPIRDISLSPGRPTEGTDHCYALRNDCVSDYYILTKQTNSFDVRSFALTSCIPYERSSIEIIQYLSQNKKPRSRWNNRPYCLTGNYLVISGCCYYRFFRC